MSDGQPAIDENFAFKMGRSLHIGVIGLGQCGGNIAERFATRKYPALAVNTSKTDLRALSQLDEDSKIYVGSEVQFGAGGSLSLGGEALRGATAKIEEKALKLFDDVEVVLAVGGLGGGTGGNLAELVNLLASTDIPVVAMGVLPASSEGHRAKTNALWALNELVDSDMESLIVVDNDKLFGSYGSASLDKFLRECNDAVVESVDTINQLSNKDELSSIRTFDPNDLRQVLRFGGVTVFGATDKDGPIGRESLGRALHRILDDNKQLATGFSASDIVVLGTVVTAPAHMLADTSASAFEDFQREVKGNTGGSVHRSGIYASQSGGARMYAIAAGLPLPRRASDLLGEATSESKLFGEKKTAARAKLSKLDLTALGVSAESQGDSAAAGGGNGAVEDVAVVEADLEVVEVDENFTIEAD